MTDLELQAAVQKAREDATQEREAHETRHQQAHVKRASEQQEKGASILSKEGGLYTTGLLGTKVLKREIGKRVLMSMRGVQRNGKSMRPQRIQATCEAQVWLSAT